MAANFQSTVRREQTAGFIGEVIEDGPSRAFPLTLVSNLAANNIFGRVFTHIAASDTDGEAGGTGAFAGILTAPKQNVTSGDVAGAALDPTLTLRNNEIGQIMDMGIIVVTQADAGGASIGDDLFYDPTNTNATSGALSVVNGAPYTVQVPGAKVVRHNTTGAGICFIQLTN